MSALVDVLTAVSGVLEDLGIVHAVTGSVASSIHGEPRVSIDVDLICRMTPEQARRLAAGLPERFYVDVETLARTARVGGMANAIDANTGLKVDLTVPPPDTLSDQALDRRRRVAFGDGADALEFWVVSPEDIVLQKLEWRRSTKSTKQWETALGVLRVQGTSLDWGYLRARAASLGLLEDLDALRDEAGV